MCFCIALLHAGIFPATLAFTLWSLPGALTMFGLALGVHNLPSRLPAIVYALLSGLNASTIMRPEAAAVKRRTQAGVSNMESEREDTTAVAATPARTTQTVNRVHASNEPTISPVPDTTTHNISVKLGLSLIAGFFTSFIIIMVIRATLTNTRPFNLFSNMYLAGTIIFGGGPVVIPLLRSYVVDPGWVSPRDFLLGLAIIQAMPGPNFNFAVYLGALAVSSTSTPTIIGAILGFIGIFFPGMVLAVGVQSVWQVMRTKRWVLSLLRGINATAVGLVFTAVYRLWEIGYLTPESSDGKSLASEPWWVVVAAVAYAETAWFGVPPAAAILIGAVLGLAWYGAVGR
ncbi:ChrA, Chromate transport protein ChrA [Pyrenophora tritici-repentis]|uniref:ChrA, Chromate transport protein ChrA n=1 Tax=Pyrenophora tritici-repentis TaxID=45151 RepID=A0A834RJH0_9PLEO|nr:ChrA, Chromate transport protein ChrA [Pyrenophora tritici-repentis]